MKLSYAKRTSLSGYVFLSPWLLGAIFFLIFPFTFSLVLSFSGMDANNFSTMHLIGWENYKAAFVSDVEFLPLFYVVATDTLVNTPMIVIFALIAAIFVSRDIRGKGFFRAVFFLPVLLGAGFVMEQLRGQNVQAETMEMARGILMPEQLRSYLGPEISQYISAFFTRITDVMWNSGVQIIILLAGVQGITPALYEVARVDGASEWEMFWKITLPMMAPILLLTIVYTIVASFTKASGMMDYIISKAFGSSVPEFAFSAAMGWIYFVFVLLVLGVVFLLMRPSVRRVSDR
ncbi:MAG: sugar ABC transporter permease [Clostridia bacterium]|nr:sugar ABC transporter permease [Clostridia bacterium]